MVARGLVVEDTHSAAAALAVGAFAEVLKNLIQGV
jgi:hypothetical protein